LTGGRRRGEPVSELAPGPLTEDEFQAKKKQILGI
jgi:hypothetical protein